MSNSASDMISRRRMLVRLGLAAGAAYAVPTLAGFDAARASGNSGGNSGGNSRGGNSGPSRSSGPSRNSAPSRNSRPGRNSRPSRNSRPARAGRGQGNGTTPEWLRRMFR
ncbi:hypothetical protein [Pseudogemmobacter sonorensis]|uniref:hypothetical protein n=1 Tax=Pseudogemmobacter sonorensis TaxID=2989681 RepID=UPI0036B9F770